MFASPTPLKVAPALRARRPGLRLHVKPDAFGNALGNSLAQQLTALQSVQAQQDYEEYLKDQAGKAIWAPRAEDPPAGTGLRPGGGVGLKWGGYRAGQAPDANPGLSPEALRSAAALQAAYEGYGVPTGDARFITGKDVRHVSEAFYKVHRRAPTPAEAVALGGNYNSLTSAHEVGNNRELFVPRDLSILDGYTGDKDQLMAYKAMSKYFDSLKEQRANAALSDMFRTYKDGKLYVSPQNKALYDAIFNEGHKGVMNYERAMSQPSATYNSAEPSWIEQGQASSTSYYEGVKDSAVERGGLSGFGLYYGAHVGGLLAQTGYGWLSGGYGLYQLGTSASARAQAWNAMSDALTHPGAVVSGLQQGWEKWWAQPFGEKADDVFKLGATTLAGGVFAKLKVPGANSELTLRVPVTTLSDGTVLNATARPTRILAGDPNKVAIIGRSMDAVNGYAAALRTQGIEPYLFSSSMDAGMTVPTVARNEFIDLSRRFGGTIPDSVLPNTKMFQTNEAWAQILKHENYTVLDLGNPFNKPKPSLFYNAEQKVIFGEKR